MQKTENQILSMTLPLMFGEKSYRINILRILAAEEWRQDYVEALIPLCKSFDDAVHPESFGEALMRAFIGFPEKIRELVFAYAPDLPKDEILEVASDRQFAVAFTLIMQEAYPFLAPLRMVTQVMESRQQSANSTK